MPTLVSFVLIPSVLILSYIILIDAALNALPFTSPISLANFEHIVLNSTP